MSDTDLSHWLTKREAAAVLGVAEKTIERLAARKEIQQGTRKRVGMPAVVVFHPDDVARIKAGKEAESKPGSFVVPADQAHDGRAVMTTRVAGTELRPVLEHLFEVITQRSRSSATVVPITDKLYLTIHEAALLSGLPETHIRASVKDGKVSGLKTGAGWRVKRADIMRVFGG